MFDEGDKLILQQRENTINATPWYNVGDDNSQGPLTVLPALESATASWTNVNDQAYEMGTTPFQGIAFTGCNDTICNKNTYILSERTAKARMITKQETMELGCTTEEKSCPVWMSNYLFKAIENGGTQETTDHGYWTLSAYLPFTSNALIINYPSSVVSTYTSNKNYGARAVIVIDK